MRHEISIEGEARMERKYPSPYLSDYRGKKLKVICRECATTSTRCWRRSGAIACRNFEWTLPALKCPNVENIYKNVCLIGFAHETD
jgi:hypothetical protein